MDINVENLSDAELNLLIDRIAETREKRKIEKREYFFTKLEKLWEDIEKAGFCVYLVEDGDYYGRIFFHNLQIEE